MAELRHQRLRRLYRSCGYTLDDIARCTGQCKNTVCYKMAGIYSWTLDDVYAICDLLQIKPYNIPHYFPRHGVDKFGPAYVERVATEDDVRARKVVDALRLAFDKR